jgi:hypothetical protein
MRANLCTSGKRYVSLTRLSNCLVRMVAHSYTRLFVRPFFRSYARSLARAFIPWRVRPPARSHHNNIAQAESTRPLARSYAHFCPLACWFLRSFPFPRVSHGLDCPFTHSSNRSILLSLVCSLVTSLARPFVHLLGRLFACLTVRPAGTNDSQSNVT